MSPYAPLYRHPEDQAIMWSLVAVWIIVGLVGARQRFQDAVPSEAFLLAASRAFIALCIAIGFIYLIGLVFLVWLKITSVFWAFWQLLFLMSVVAVFWVAPAFGIVLLCWALVGRRRLCHSPRALILTARGLVALAADVLLYYAIEVSIVYQSSGANAG